MSEFEGYRVLDGADDLLGLTTGGTDSAAHIKLGRANLNRWFPVAAYGSELV